MPSDFERWNYYMRTIGPSGFGSSATAEEVTEGLDLTGKTVIITGGSSGIGAEAARVLAKRGAEVVLAVRSVDAGEATRQSIAKEVANAKVRVMALDLSSLESVRTFAETFLKSGLPLNILINNAGVMACPFGLSKEGHELQFATNHLGHFLLTERLRPKLKETANASKQESRIVILSSEAHEWAPPEGVTLDKLDSPEGYKPVPAYGRSKLANMLHAQELDRRLKAEGVENVTVNCLHPGVIMTNLGRHAMSPMVQAVVGTIFSPFLKSIPQGAATTCYVATHPSVTGVSGKYFVDSNVFEPGHPKAGDQKLAGDLWDVSTKLTSA